MSGSDAEGIERLRMAGEPSNENSVERTQRGCVALVFGEFFFFNKQISFVITLESLILSFGTADARKKKNIYIYFA